MTRLVGRKRVPNSSNKITQDDRVIVNGRFSVDDDREEYDALEQEFTEQLGSAKETFHRENYPPELCIGRVQIPLYTVLQK
jgi:hypothetical protein